MSKASCKIVKVASCKIARHVVEDADIEFGPDGEIYSYDINRTRDVVEMDIIDEYDVEPGEDLVKDTKEALEEAFKAIEKYGSDKVELLINKEEDELYVHYHSKYDSVEIYVFTGYTLKNDFVLNYIKGEFEKAEIDICEY